ncbi:hypothetical protein, partial [Terrabacter terrae]|uniref:hypothetical protein n=1 Tax=Terrabacter terrae TaxID=318434 RepID=UPI0031DA0FE3
MNEQPELRSFIFGQDLPWAGELAEVDLYVELPFWLMMQPASVTIERDGCSFVVNICIPQVEVFVGECLDSRRTIAWRGPQSAVGDWTPPDDLQAIAEERDLSFMSRPCKTVLRIRAQGLEGAFGLTDDDAPPRSEAERDAYWDSLCEAHIPIINELIQRYRLVTYDYFAYEVSAWDVPIWHVRLGETSRTVVLMPYKEWDYRPLEVVPTPEDGGEPPRRPFQFTYGGALDATDSSIAVPGEFDLLDARSLMERGDYTGAVRRATTAIEAVVEWRLRKELLESLPAQEVEDRLRASQNDFPGRFRQLQKILGTKTAWQQLADEFERTRKMRHEIVHQARRLTHEERGIAQRSVDTGRWLFNHIEDVPNRARIRDFGGLKSVGRVAMAMRFDTRITASGV